MFCILLNIIAACTIITQIHSFYPNPWTRMTVHLCREIRGNPMRETRKTTETKLYMNNSPFVLKNNSTNNTTKHIYVGYDTILWENGELAWDLPDEKNITDNNTVSPDILRILGITPLNKNITMQK